MADCNKTIDFWKEWLRKCEAENNNFFAEILSCIDPKEAVKCIQEWSNEHPLPPQKTYADDFFEKFPNAKHTIVCSSKIPIVCRERVYGTSIYDTSVDSFGDEYCILKGLCGSKDRAECWLEPYPEEG